LLQDEEGWKKSGQSEDVVFHERKPTVPAAWRVVHGKRRGWLMEEGLEQVEAEKLGRLLVEVEF
jgi:hypothetical protein